MRIAFLAPIKPPDHPIPSGDRLIGGNTVAALAMAGFDVRLASRFIAYSKRADDGILVARKREALAEAEAAIARLRDAPPDLVFTYHPYCKAPDWIGPRVAAAFGVPYVTLEAARTGQGFEEGGDRWARWRAEAQAGFAAAALHITMKPTDRAMLRAVLGADAPLADLSPFIDVPPAPAPAPHDPNGPPRLVTAAMMRPGKKALNFALLSDAMTRLADRDWTLDIVGGGPEEDDVRAAFAPLGGRVRLLGERTHEGVLDAMAAGDLFVWPGLREPIGMVYLEAQAMGLPVAALADMGVPLVVRDGETGRLSERHDAEGLAAVIGELLDDPAERLRLAGNSRDAVMRDHSLEAASQRLHALLSPLMGG